MSNQIIREVQNMIQSLVTQINGGFAEIKKQITTLEDTVKRQQDEINQLKLEKAFQPAKKSVASTMTPPSVLDQPMVKRERIWPK